jgi:Zn-dependent M28 family amino/carboxypeptidase
LEGLRSGAISELRLKSGLTLVPAGAANVVGILPGVGTAERPDLARETVVLSAHYDHLGLVGEGGHGGEQSSQDGEPDLVYNGADDDASGTAAVLELAGALAAADPPVRTVVFLLATGEEKGLLGTKYYLDHPAVPLADTIFNLNFEMIGRPDELAEGVGGLWLTGHGRTTMWAEAQEAGVELFADQRPNEHFFERSDNYAFVMRGILGQTLSSYNMHSDYHRVSDEADLLDYEHMELGVRRGLGLVRLLLSGELTPRWVPGGEPQRRRR